MAAKRARTPASKTDRDRVYAVIARGRGDGATSETIQELTGLDGRRVWRHAAALCKQGRIRSAGYGRYVATEGAEPGARARPALPAQLSFLPAEMRARIARRIAEQYARMEAVARDAARREGGPLTARQLDRRLASVAIADEDARRAMEGTARRHVDALLTRLYSEGHAVVLATPDGRGAVETAILFDDVGAARWCATCEALRATRAATTEAGLHRFGAGSAENLALLASLDLFHDRDLAKVHATTTARIAGRRADLRRRGLRVPSVRVRNLPEMPPLDAARQLMRRHGLTMVRVAGGHVAYRLDTGRVTLPSAAVATL